MDLLSRSTVEIAALCCDWLKNSTHPFRVWGCQVSVNPTISNRGEVRLCLPNDTGTPKEGCNRGHGLTAAIKLGSL